jgi:ATP phosphoribosyltransferase
MRLKIALPKGSLQNSTMEIFKKAGFNIAATERSYSPVVDDEELEVILIRAQEIPRYVSNGSVDLGITGKDWIMETKAKVIEVANLVYAKRGLRPVSWVLAVPETSNIKKIKDLEDKTIATELVNETRSYLRKNKVKAKVEYSWGATEIKAPEFVDAIVELTETGRSLKANNLRIIDKILESTTRVITNKKSYSNRWKKQKINNLVLLLKGALLAEDFRLCAHRLFLI